MVAASTGAVRVDKGCGDLLRVTLQCLAAPACTEKDVLERQPVLGAKPLRIGCQIGRELFVAWVRGSHVLGEKLHLLPHPPADDGVVAIEPKNLALAIKHFVANAALDEAKQFLGDWRALPCPRETIGQVLDLSRGNDDLGRLRLLLADQTVEAEQRRPEHQEMQQWLPQQARHGAYRAGVAVAISRVCRSKFAWDDMRSSQEMTSRTAAAEP